MKNKWQFRDVELFTVEKILALTENFRAWFLHLSPRFSMAAQVFQFPAAGDNESSAAIAARDPKIVRKTCANQSVDVRPKKT